MKQNSDTAFLDVEEIKAIEPLGNNPEFPDDLARPLRDGLQKHGNFTTSQLAGRTFPIACVALEITQRCNLDCTLCYLSDLAEVVKDVPLFEIERRLDIIHRHYGDFTNIQITGGDPTLRSIPDLVKIVKLIKQHKMRAALFTNGIKASRKMLEALSSAGLDDVVFHVDMTQERKGYTSEAELNAIREEYIARATGLPLRVMFNTTVFDQNFHEVPNLASFFVSQADKIYLASFQMQADTGRGVMGKRDDKLITQESVMNALKCGTGLELNFDFPLIGHTACNKYTSLLVSGEARTNLFDDKPFFDLLFDRVSKVGQNWADPFIVVPKSMQLAITSPKLMWGGLKFMLRKAWQLKTGLIKGKRVHRLNLFIHNFMDAEKLVQERCEGCVFMVATVDGPLSMCVHNAKRDQMITKPVQALKGQRAWNPLEPGTSELGQGNLPFKRMKGKLRKQASLAREKDKA
ncbi:MAG: radical SAM protein [Pseudomonadota bacterium]